MSSPVGTVRAVAASCILLPRALPRIWRLQVKRGVYLSGVNLSKKKKKRNPIQKETARESAAGEAALGAPLADGPPTSWKIAVPHTAQARAVKDVTIDLEEVDRRVIDDWTRDDGLRHDKSSRSSPAGHRPVIRITSLLEMVRIRREQASRTLLFVPGREGVGEAWYRFSFDTFTSK